MSGPPEFASWASAISMVICQTTQPFNGFVIRLTNLLRHMWVHRPEDAAEDFVDLFVVGHTLRGLVVRGLGAFWATPNISHASEWKSSGNGPFHGWKKPEDENSKCEKRQVAVLQFGNERDVR